MVPFVSAAQELMEETEGELPIDLRGAGEERF